LCIVKKRPTLFWFSDVGGVAKKSMGVYWILLLNFILFGLAKFGGQMWITVRPLS
jgi:hypothetical protein